MGWEIEGLGEGVSIFCMWDPLGRPLQAASKKGDKDRHLLVCVIPPPWVWVAFLEWILTNTVWQKWWDVTSKIRLSKEWMSSLALQDSLHPSFMCRMAIPFLHGSHLKILPNPCTKLKNNGSRKYTTVLFWCSFLMNWVSPNWRIGISLVYQGRIWVTNPLTSFFSCTTK